MKLEICHLGIDHPLCKIFLSKTDTIFFSFLLFYLLETYID